MQNKLLALLLVFLVEKAASTFNCEPERKFSLLAPCQETCEHKKPWFCLPGPGCYCADGKMWDRWVKRCVYQSECSNKAPKTSGGLGFGGDAAVHLGGLGNIRAPWNLTGSLGGGGGQNSNELLDIFGDIFNEGAGGSSSGSGSIGGGGHIGGGGQIGGGGHTGGGGHIGGGGGVHIGGNGGSVHGSISIRHILKALFSLPIRLPMHILKFVKNLIVSIVTLNFEALKIPYRIIRSVALNAEGFIRRALKGTFHTLIKVSSFNADVVAGIISHIRGGIAWIIKQLVTVHVNIIKVLYDIANFFRKRAGDIIGGAIKLVAWILEHVGMCFNGILKILHVRQIIHLPVIRNVFAILNGIRHRIYAIICSQVTELGRFINSIIYQHKDFFIPILERIFNDIYALLSACKSILTGGKMTGISATIGGFHFGVGPWKTGWVIDGIGGESIGEGHISTGSSGSSSGSSAGSSWGGTGGTLGSSSGGGINVGGAHSGWPGVSSGINLGTSGSISAGHGTGHVSGIIGGLGGILGNTSDGSSGGGIGGKNGSSSGGGSGGHSNSGGSGGISVGGHGTGSLSGIIGGVGGILGNTSDGSSGGGIGGKKWN